MMRKRLWLLLAPVLAGCAESATQVAPAFEVAAERDGLRLVLAGTPQETRPGGTIRLTTSLTNRSGQDVRLDFSDGCQVVFYVEDDAGRIVFPSGGDWGCYQALTHLELGAGEVLQRSTDWVAVAEEYADGGSRRTPLPPGRYRAYAVLRGEISTQARMRTETVELRVR